MNWTEKIKIFSKYFSKPLFTTFYATLFIIIMSRKIFFKVRTHLSIHNFGLQASPGNAIEVTLFYAILLLYYYTKI